MKTYFAYYVCGRCDVAIRSDLTRRRFEKSAQEWWWMCPRCDDYKDAVGRPREDWTGVGEPLRVQPEPMAPSPAMPLMTELDWNEITHIAEHVHGIAVEHGFHGDYAPDMPSAERQLAMLALIASEVGEAVEEVRRQDGGAVRAREEDGKPEGLGYELADIVIRCLDMAASLGMDIGEIMRLKDAFNATRPRLHGKRA